MSNASIARSSTFRALVRRRAPRWLVVMLERASRLARAIVPTRDANLIQGLAWSLTHRGYASEGMSFDYPRALFPVHLRSRFANDRYEAIERRLVRRYVEPGDRVLELGACIGVVACCTNRLLDNASQHIVVEANPVTYQHLVRNKENNGARFTAENCIISNHADVRFDLSGDMTSARVSAHGQRYVGAVRTLEDVLSQHSFAPNVLIIDIEGGEKAFLRENVAFLRGLDKVIVEFHPNVLLQEEISSCHRLLAEAGLGRSEQCDDVEVWLRVSSAAGIEGLSSR